VLLALHRQRDDDRARGLTLREIDCRLVDALKQLAAVRRTRARRKSPEHLAQDAAIHGVIRQLQRLANDADNSEFGLAEEPLDEPIQRRPEETGSVVVDDQRDLHLRLGRAIGDYVSRLPALFDDEVSGGQVVDGSAALVEGVHIYGSFAASAGLSGSRVRERH
jgi:hypothetical protein